MIRHASIVIGIAITSVFTTACRPGTDAQLSVGSIDPSAQPVATCNSVGVDDSPNGRSYSFNIVRSDKSGVQSTWRDVGNGVSADDEYELVKFTGRVSATKGVVVEIAAKEAKLASASVTAVPAAAGADKVTSIKARTLGTMTIAGVEIAMTCTIHGDLDTTGGDQTVKVKAKN